MPVLLMEKYRSLGSVAETYYRILMDKAAAEMSEEEYAQYLETFRQVSGLR